MKLLACGSNGKYQLGNGTDLDSNHLVPCKFNDNGIELIEVSVPLKMAHGGNHSLILFDNGDVFSSGDNTFGQCASENDTQVFTKIPGSWTNIACGWEFSVLTKKNSVYICGCGHKGELGLGSDVTQTQLIPLHFENLGQVLDVKCSINFTVLKTSTGFYGWGNSKRGQLLTNSIVWSPIQLQINPIEFEVTRDTLIVLDHQRLYSIGKFTIDIPSQITSFKTMWSSVHYQINDTLHALGNNSHGQLSDEGLKGFKFYEIGSEHGVIQYDNLYAWGWGEHGNCGPKPKEQESSNTFTKLNCILQRQACFVSCGCATTFVGID